MEDALAALKQGQSYNISILHTYYCRYLNIFQIWSHSSSLFLITLISPFLISFSHSRRYRFFLLLLSSFPISRFLYLLPSLLSPLFLPLSILNPTSSFLPLSFTLSLPLVIIIMKIFHEKAKHHHGGFWHSTCIPKLYLFIIKIKTRNR